MRNQISASLSLDVAALADVIADTVAERLGSPVHPVSLHEAATALAFAFTEETGLQDYSAIRNVCERLAADGYTFTRRVPSEALTPSATQTTPLTDRDEGWFSRTEE
jgi:hypothetical protein